MKKRLISLFMVITIIFSGVFSLLASAASPSVGQRLFDFYFDHIFLSPDLDFWGIADKPRGTARDFLHDLLFDQAQTNSEDDINFDNLNSSLFGSGILQNVSYWETSLDRPEIFTNACAVLPGKGLKCTVDPNCSVTINPTCANYSSSQLQFYYSDTRRHTEWGNYNIRGSYTFQNNSNNPVFLYLRFCVISTDKPIDVSSVRVDYSGGFHWGWDTDITFQSSFTKNALGDLDIDLTSSRDIMPDIDGACKIISGILYDFGGDLTYAADFVKGGTYTSGRNWKWSFDLGDFSYYLYRKRLGTENFYSFVSVYSLKDNKFLYFNSSPLSVDPPGGIFDDVQDPPNWRDYKPEPSEPPDPPTFDVDYIFNYSISSNDYRNFNFTTINNYNGGSGGGSGGIDDNSQPDDSSSGTDDPSVGSDSGDDSNFDSWFSDAVVTINNNVTDGIDTLNENVRIIKEDIENYFTAVQDYLEGYLNDWIEYIAALINKFNDDFNAWADAFAIFLGDHLSTINHNITIVGDNIVKAIKTQVIPDKDVVFNIATSHFPFVSDINDIFTTYEVQSKDLIISIPLFGVDSDNVAMNSSGQGNSYGTSGGSSDPINTVDGACYNVNITSIVNDYGLSELRTIGSVFILVSTLFSLLNITLKIFGLNFE